MSLKQMPAKLDLPLDDSRASLPGFPVPRNAQRRRRVAQAIATRHCCMLRFGGHLPYPSGDGRDLGSGGIQGIPRHLLHSYCTSGFLSEPVSFSIRHAVNCRQGHAVTE
jgi:hypothetical protein